jgi:hypothetical protein
MTTRSRRTINADYRNRAAAVAIFRKRLDEIAASLDAHSSAYHDVVVNGVTLRVEWAFENDDGIGFTVEEAGTPVFCAQTLDEVVLWLMS